MTAPIKGLTLTQPYSTLMALLKKRNETRGWYTSYRGLVAIHSGKKFPQEERESCFADPFAAALGIKENRDAFMGITAVDPGLPLGTIQAVSIIHRVRASEVVGPELERAGASDELAFGNYDPHRWIFETTGTVALPRPIPCKGALNLWQIPTEVRAEIIQQLRELDPEMTALLKAGGLEI